MARNIIENPFKARLTTASTGATVAFDVSPTVSENRSVNYNSLEPLHAPGQIQVYKNTSSRNFQISDIKLISRTVGEADRNMRKLWLLRSWCMPRFGNSSTLSEDQLDEREYRRNAGRNADIEREISTRNDTLDVFNKRYGVELLGAPPPILYFSAYSKSVGTSTDNSKSGTTNRWEYAQHINRVPVVIQQLTIPYPNDVDYITTSKGTPFPSIMNIDLALIETHSPNAYEGFNLSAFKEGRLKGF